MFENNIPTGQHCYVDLITNFTRTKTFWTCRYSERSYDLIVDLHEIGAKENEQQHRNAPDKVYTK